MIEKLKETLASTQIQEFLEKMNQMGFDKKETLQLIEKILREDKS